MENDHLYLRLFAIAGVIGLVLTPIAMRVARAVGLIDQPNVRKVHKTPVPRIGGVVIVLATLLSLVTTLGDSTGLFGTENAHVMATLLIGAASIAAVGFLDDIFDVPGKFKLLALLAASGAFCAAGGAPPTLTISGHTVIHLGLAAWPVTMLWIVGVTVAINFIDGIDGLAGGIALITAVVLAVGATAGGDPTIVLVMAALVGGISAFLVYNTHPAKVFMGDCGSMFLGYVLAASCALAARQIGATRGFLLPAMTLSIPLLDTLFTMVRRRVLERRSIFAAERGHIHHRLLGIGLSQWHVVLLMYGVTATAATVSVICIYGGPVVSGAALVAFLFVLTALFRLAGSVRARDTIDAIRRNRALDRETQLYRKAFFDLQLRFREVKNFDGWWRNVCRAAEVLDFAKVDLPLTRRDGTTTTMRWRRSGDLVADAGSITAEVPVPQRRSDETLRASIEVQVSGFLESGGQRVALFSRLMSEFGLNQIKYAAERNDTPAPVASTAPGVFEPGTTMPGVRVAVVHDFLYTYAGAERVLEQMLQVFPQADVFSLFDFLPEGGRQFLGNRPVQSSFLQKLPFARKKHRAYLPLMPLAIEQLDVSKYDLVLSSSYVAAKGVITRPDQLHICYCHTPVRFAWDLQNQYLGQVGLRSGVRALLAKIVLHYIRNWDVRSANGVDVFVANSDYVGRRIQKVYRRESQTVYPPVDTDYFSLETEKQDFYVTASRLVPYKRIDLIVEAFSKMPDKRLVVVGDGPEMARIKAKAGPNVTLLGHASGESLRQHLQRAKAFVFAAEEDFGITPVEAQACGTPIIAFGRGGVTESVVSSETGLFFEFQTVESIVQTVEQFEQMTWNPVAIRAHAEKFSQAAFRDNLADFITDQWESFRSNKVLVDIAPNPGLIDIPAVRLQP